MRFASRIFTPVAALCCGLAALGAAAQHPSGRPAPQPLIITPVEPAEASAMPAEPGTTPPAAPERPAPSAADAPASAANAAAVVALLLPASGKLADAGQAVREGVTQAYYSQAAAAPPLHLRFYPVDSPDEARARYDQAVAEGAKVVIGPLQKEAVAALAASGELSVPVLALNHLPAGLAAPAALHQFALEPEEEAGQAAERMALDGLLQVFVVTASGAFNARLSAAFRPRLIAAGGSVTDELRLAASTEEWAAQIKRAFKVKVPPKPGAAAKPAAGAAPAQAAGAADAPPPVLHREDVNAIFFAGNAQQLRQFMLYLDFHRIALPVFSTSQVWSGRRAGQAGVSGVEFPDAPFMIADNPQGAAAQALWPASSAKYPRLLAMGLDAWEWALRLAGITGHPQDVISGATGELRLDASRRVQRLLSWARLRDGLAVAAGQAPVQAPVAPAATPPAAAR